MGGKSARQRSGFFPPVAFVMPDRGNRSPRGSRLSVSDTLPILLIEDNPMDVDLTQRAFIRHKLANPLRVARDGQEALDLI